LADEAGRGCAAGTDEGGTGDFADGSEAAEGIGLRDAGDALRAVAFILNLGGAAGVIGEHGCVVRIDVPPGSARSIIRHSNLLTV